MSDQPQAPDATTPTGTKTRDPELDVSVVIPTYNRHRLLRDAIDSCLRQTADKGLRIQVVVVDDGSTDKTRELLQRYGGQIEPIFFEENVGHIAALNGGQKRALGRYIKFLGSDDMLVDGILKQEVSVADATGADIVVTGWESVRTDEHGNTVDGSRRVYDAPEIDPIPEAILLGRSPTASAALYRRSYIEDLAWDPQTSPLDDWDFFCQAALRMGKVVRLDAVSFLVRHHPGPSVSADTLAVDRSRCHHRILKRIENSMRERNALSANRAKRLAQYYYKELRVLSLYDWEAVDKALEWIFSLDPHFVPRDEEPRRSIRVLARLLGTRRVLRLYSLFRKALAPALQRQRRFV